jgi:hypothetical protein
MPHPIPYNPQDPAIAALIADGWSEADFETDNVIACLCCGTRYLVEFHGNLAAFDPDIREADGVFVCTGCAGEYREDAAFGPDGERVRAWA